MTNKEKGLLLLFDDYNNLRAALRDIFALTVDAHEDCGTFRAEVQVIVFKALTGVAPE